MRKAQTCQTELKIETEIVHPAESQAVRVVSPIAGVA